MRTRRRRLRIFVACDGAKDLSDLSFDRSEVVEEEWRADLFRDGQAEQQASLIGADLVADPYVFTDSIDGAEPWKPGSVSQFFSRLRERAGLEHLDLPSPSDGSLWSVMGRPVLLGIE